MAVKKEPVAPRLRYILANAPMAAGRFDAAAGYCQNLPDGFPGKSEWLGRARLGRDLNCPEFALVRGDPRLKPLRQRVGLPE
jgi:hypothetical protein